MKFLRGRAGTLFIGACIFWGLVIGGYLVSPSEAVSPSRVYLTDPSGSNGANVSGSGHLSVHVADPNLPATTGAKGIMRLVYPDHASLSRGQCYEAYVRGKGLFVTATVTDRPGTGTGTPPTLVRIDKSAVWREDSSAESTPLTLNSGVLRSGPSTVFGWLGYTPQFDLFAGVGLCWNNPGASDRFSVELTVSGIAHQPLDPEEMLFSAKRRAASTTFSWTHAWVHQPGITPFTYSLYGTDFTAASYYRRLATPVPYDASTEFYSVTIPTPKYTRYYVFQDEATTDPTRVGPFGSWDGL